MEIPVASKAGRKNGFSEKNGFDKIPIGWTIIVPKYLLLRLGKCDIFVKRKISVINEMKQDKILLKLKDYYQENLHGIP
jgi:hypothetical protein